MRNIFIILITATQLFAFLETRTSLNETEVLDSLDIDRSFINSSLYRSFEDPSRHASQQTFFASMNRGFSYVPKVRQKIQDSQIPEAFLYMAMAESGFSLRAYSSASASGLWQFMPLTGKRFGLEINEYVDERRDPIKSTEAAIEYLKYLHDRFDKWYLVALAYNGGEGRLSRAISRAGTDDLEVLIDPQKRYLPRETRQYIKRIVNFALIAQNRELMLSQNFEYLLNRGEAYSLARVTVPGGESLERVSQIIRVNMRDLKLYNPHLKYGITPPYAKEYDIYIPYMNLIDFKARYNSDDIESFFVVHEVQRGDSIGAIANKYGLRSSVVMAYNSLDSHIIHPGQTIVVPVPRQDYQQRLNPRVYEVQSGDTLSKIARKFNISVSKLKQINNKTDNMVFIGEQIVVSN